MSDIVYTHADAWLEDFGNWRNWRPEQWVTLGLVDDDELLAPAYCALTSHQARELAFQLLVLAEHADQRARGEEAA